AGLGSLQLIESVAVRARIGGVLDEGLTCPRLGAFPVVVVLVVLDEEDGELAPCDDLVKEAVAGGSRRLALSKGFFDGEGYGEGADVAEVEVGREAAGASCLGMV